MPIYRMDGKKDGKNRYRVRVNYQDNMGKYKQIDRITYGNDEAKNLERELLHNLKKEVTHSNITLQCLFEEYIIVKKHEVRESTLDKTIRILKFHILPDLGNLKLNKLNTSILQKWKLNIENKLMNNKENLSVTTKKNIYAEFRAMLNYAVKMEYLSQNPLIRVGNFKDTNTIHKEMNYYTADEFQRFSKVAFKYAKKAEKSNNIYEWNYYVFFCIAFYTGLRKGEIHGLQWNDISDNKFLSVKRSITQKVKGGDRVTPPKNRTSIRTIQIPVPLQKVLSEHYKRCKTIAEFQEELKICGGTKALRDTSVENHNIRFAEIAGIKKIRIHDFRHSHASLLANNGINIQEIARRLGHAKIEMTWNTYSHLYSREEEKAMQVLDKIV